MLSISAPPVFTLAMTASFHVDGTVELDMEKRVYRRVTKQISTATITTIPTIGATFRPVFFPQKTGAPVSTGPSVNV